MSTKKLKELYIVEDNEIYAKQLEFIVKNKFGDKCVVSILNNGKELYTKITKNQIPDIIIMDHFLNDKEEMFGYDTLINLKNKFPNTLLILHTSQEDFYLAVDAAKSKTCTYIAKGKEGFDRINEAIQMYLEKNISDVKTV